MEPHFHWSIENLLFLFLALALIRYAVIHGAAAMTNAGGFLGQLGLAIGGIVK